ncbi:MAG: dihydroneopterin aldolase family protein [Candidatus Freyarchaeota archaeon]|nr:dihydroneopterin aldolase family protein [Candidatus Jordarchaeia archaeon]
MNDEEDLVKRFFGNDVTDRDRAVFEAGIKLGAIYHQFMGVPLSKRNILTVEKAIEETVSCQPYVESARVKIKPPQDSNSRRYGYSEVSGRNLSVRLVVKYGHVRVFAGMEYVPELNYPLMFIEKLEEEAK